MKQLVYFANCCFSSCAGQNHKDSVQEATVEDDMANHQSVIKVAPTSNRLRLASCLTVL